MLILHQWRRITAFGEDAIIRKANEYKFREFLNALTIAARGFTPITRIDDAITYFEDSERGYVNDEIQRNEIKCEE